MKPIKFETQDGNPVIVFECRYLLFFKRTRRFLGLNSFVPVPGYHNWVELPNYAKVLDGFGFYLDTLYKNRSQIKCAS